MNIYYLWTIEPKEWGIVPIGIMLITMNGCSSAFRLWKLSLIDGNQKSPSFSKGFEKDNDTSSDSDSTHNGNENENTYHGMRLYFFFSTVGQLFSSPIISMYRMLGPIGFSFFASYGTTTQLSNTLQTFANGSQDGSHICGFSHTCAFLTNKNANKKLNRIQYRYAQTAEELSLTRNIQYR